MSKKILHYILLIILLSSSFFIVSYDSRKKSLDDFAYCMALGIDVSSTSPLKLSFQIPSVESSSESSKERAVVHNPLVHLYTV